MKRIEREDFLQALAGTRDKYHDQYHSMYSSVLAGIVTDPVLMVVPVDDHVVHRGDGVFETFKCVAGSIYNMAGHLDRLERSARALALTLPCTRSELETTVIETVRAGGKRDCLVRVLVSRGPGSLGVNPGDSIGAQLYVVVARLKESFMILKPGGARARTTSLPAKMHLLAGAKTCNYALNMLMAKEALESGVDFAVGFDPDSCLTEGATENIGIVHDDGRLLFPRSEQVLPGTTMMRVAELGEQLVEKGMLKDVNFEPIPRASVLSAREILVVGTTRDVTAVVELDGQPVGSGEPGPVYRALAGLLAADISGNTQLLTSVYQPSLG